MRGPCVKQRVIATIISRDGLTYVGENDCASPQQTCPRGDMPTGVGYHLCKEVCHQGAHAEVNAIAAAGEAAWGATLYLEGHTYACLPCTDKCDAAGILEIVIGAPPDGEFNVAQMVSASQAQPHRATARQ
jgi:deoxycytidylate deaminase